jgi:colanic acid biosynthesis glycosyl transferase WcaI
VAKDVNILLLTLVFPPDGVSNAHLLGELAEDLRAAGHAVTALTTTPHYNRDPVAEAAQPLRGSGWPLVKRSERRGIRVYHVVMPRKGSRVLPRLLGWAGFHLVGTLAGLLAVPRPDVILAPSPPLTIGLSAWAIGALRRAPFVYNVQEMYPDIAIRLGALRSRPLIGILRGLERFVYRKAALVTVIAPGMQRSLREKGVPADHVAVIPNMVDVDEFSPRPKDNPFSRAHGVHEVFVVSYAGNMGAPQGLETLVDAAARLRGEPGIVFLMAGDGMRREAIRRRIESRGLKRFLFLPYQPYATVPWIYAASEVNLATQVEKAGADAVPSKVYKIMACARPVLAVTDPDSDLARLVREAGCGFAVAPGSTSELAEAVLWAYRHGREWQAMGEAGRAHAVRYYERKAVSGRYERLLREIRSPRRGGPSRA